MLFKDNYSDTSPPVLEMAEEARILVNRYVEEVCVCDEHPAFAFGYGLEASQPEHFP